jgi:hypothetical protein
MALRRAGHAHVEKIYLNQIAKAARPLDWVEAIELRELPIAFIANVWNGVLSKTLLCQLCPIMVCELPYEVSLM